MTARAWSCNGCGALVQPNEDACHRCGTLRFNNVPPEQVEPGTPAEFVTMVHRTAVGPTPPPRAPLPDTLPVETELAAPPKKSNTIPEAPAAPILVPQAPSRPSQPLPPPPAKRSLAWLLYLFIPLVLAGGAYATYWFVEPFQEYVDGMIEAAFG